MVPEVFSYLDRTDRQPVESDPDGQLYFRLLQQADALPARRATRPLLYATMLLPLALEAGLLTAESPDYVVKETLRSLAPRLGIARRDQERVQQILLSQRRMLPRKRKRTFPRALVDRSYFPESFSLFEMMVKATDSGTAELDWWNERLEELQGTGQVSPRPSPGLVAQPEEEAESGHPRRRRRRRRGRGGNKELVAEH